MNRALLKIISVVAVCGSLLVGRSMADMIHGSVTFAGSVVLDTTSVNTATQVTSWVNAHVETVEGDFASWGVVNNEAVSIAAPWSFNSASVSNFWNVGGFTFNLTSSSIAFQGSGFLAVSGTGWVTGNGFDASVGTWNFTTQNGAADGAFSFSAASAVPDGGYTALLLGLGLLGLCAAYRFSPKLQRAGR